ncbi:MAG: hypothetical protein IPL07_09870 [Acidimicrobiaceae bacterium]|nr:hypothetical protein [Acidimicrobiaceae bacterium]
MSDAPSERGIAMQRARDLAVAWAGQLRNEHHRRLGDIISRPSTSPSNWRTSGIDEALVPMVIATAEGKCRVVEALRRADLSDLLASEHWPSKQPEASVRRFLARCGNEPKPRWIDNFLSDIHHLDVSRLARFLVGVLQGLEGRTLEVLSRSQVGEDRVDTADLVAALRAGGIRPEDERRIDWRIYDKRAGNLHDRQLLLPGRTEAFFRLQPLLSDRRRRETSQMPSCRCEITTLCVRHGQAPPRSGDARNGALEHHCDLISITISFAA